MANRELLENEIKLLQEKGFNFNLSPSERAIRGEIFNIPIEFIIPPEYPDKPPVIRALVKLRHEIFDGRIARKLETLKKWKPTFHLYMVANEIKDKFIEKPPKNIVKEIRRDTKEIRKDTTSRALTIGRKPKFFGKSKWYDKLGDTIINLFIEKSKKFGGLLPSTVIFSELSSILKFDITLKDVIKALQCKAKQRGLQLIETESGFVLVKFFDPILLKDAVEIVKILVDNGGRLTLQELVVLTNWENGLVRVEQALNVLEEKGIVIIDKGTVYGTLIYLPMIRGD